MTESLQWIALAACLGCLMWRLPALLKGRNKSLFWAFAMTAVCVALSIEVIYLPVDALLGGMNVANVFVRLSLFAVFFLLASKITAAYRSPLARSLIRGPVGIAVLAISSAGIWISYFLSDLQGSSAGLTDFTDVPSVHAYMWIGKAYPAYVAACLVVPTWRAAFSRRPVLDRGAALSMCIGFGLVCLAMLTPFLPWEGHSLTEILSFSSIIFVAAGLALVWLSFLRRPINASSQKTLFH